MLLKFFNYLVVRLSIFYKNFCIMLRVNKCLLFGTNIGAYTTFLIKFNCADIDECSVGVCDTRSGATCENIVGSYQCHCPAGFRLDNTRRACLGTSNTLLCF